MSKIDITGEELTGLVAIVTLPAAALAYVAVGEQAAGVVAIVGWLLLVPVLGILTDTADEDESTPTEDPLETLRDRYARGEIDEIEFERRVERLLETEDVDVPTDREVPADRGAAREPERER